MLNFYRFTVNMVLRIFKMNCHQQLSDSFRVHKIRFRSGKGSTPNPTGRICSPDLLAGLKNTNSKGGGEGKR